MSVPTTDVSNRALPWPRESAGTTSEADFHALYTLISRPLLAYLLGVTGRRDLAEDLLQETFCRFLIRKPATMPDEEARRYLFRIATNLLRDRWRRQDDQPAPEPVDNSASVNLDVQVDVRRVMLSLRPRERELLWLAYVEGMSHAEIAAITGLGALSIRLLLFRARANAATLLEPRKVSR